jgi:hypothetical protein
MEVSIEFECYKALVEVCGKEWKDKLRVIEYLEKEMQNGVSPNNCRNCSHKTNP